MESPRFRPLAVLLALALCPSVHGVGKPAAKPSGDPIAAYPYFDQRIPLSDSGEIAVRLRGKGDLAPGRLMVEARTTLGEDLIDPASLIPLGDGIVAGRPARGKSAASARRALGARSSVAWTAPVHTPPAGNRWVASPEVIVRLSEADAASGTKPFLKDPRVIAHKLLPGAEHTYVLTLADADAGENALAFANELAASGRYRWAAPNAVQSWTRYATTNDPLLSRQWHLRNLGGSLNGNPGQNGIAGADARVLEAWDLQPGGSPSVIVAVLDDGPELGHPDLAPNLWTNPGELAGNGLDDDGNGFVDDVSGWDFSLGLPGDNSPGASSSSDEHGTAVAGVIAARGNNAVGGAGAAHGVRWFAARVFNGATAASDAAFAAAINYASGRRTGGSWSAAAITNNSYGGGSPNAAMTDAFAWGATNGRGGLGVLHVIAAGNSGASSPSYPASLAASLPNVMCIGASTDRDARSSYSQYGTGLDLVAPSNGGTFGIITTDRLGSVGYDAGDYAGISSPSTAFGGTSSATPLTSGVAALVLSHAPTLSAVDLRRILRYSTDRIGGPQAAYSGTYPPAFPLAARAGTDTELGFGRINALKALRGISAPRARAYRGGESLPPSATLALNGYAGDVTTTSLVIRNESLQTLTVSNPVVTAGPVSLEASSDAQTTLHAPGELRTLRLRLAPPASGSGTQTLTFNTNDPDNPAYSLTLAWTALPLSARGRIVLDSDGDGAADGFEPGNAGRFVFIDTDLNGALGSTGFAAATGVPMAIPDASSSGAESTLTFAQAGTVSTARVRFSITHPYTGDLEVRLVAPSGASIPLVLNRGGSGDNFTSTEIRDDAAATVSTGSAPFTGAFRPESPLLALKGESVAGTWRLRVIDPFAQDVGTLTSWSLDLVTEPVEVTDSEGVFRFRNLPAASYRIVAPADPAWLRTRPVSPAYRAFVLSSGGSVSGLDFTEARASTIHGRVFHDSDASGSAEAHEGGVPGVQVFSDANGNSQFDGITDAPQSPSDTPRALPDLATVDSLASVATNVTLSAVKVRIDSLTHTWMGDLEISLVHPDGTSVPLITNRGAEASGFTGTVLDDTAAAAIADGSAPFTGVFRPESPLSALSGKPSAGTWRLRVKDVGPADVGTLNGWTLLLSGGEPSAVTAAGGIFSLAGVPAGTVRLLATPPQGWSVLAPGGGHTFTYAPASAQNGRNFGLRGPVTPETLGIRSLSLDAGAALLDIRGLPFQNHRVQGRADLMSGDWTDIGQFMPGPDGGFQWKDPASLPGGGYFYRIVTP